jgi:hypothetical protein
MFPEPWILLLTNITKSRRVIVDIPHVANESLRRQEDFITFFARDLVISVHFNFMLTQLFVGNHLIAEHAFPYFHLFF